MASVWLCFFGYEGKLVINYYISVCACACAHFIPFLVLCLDFLFFWFSIIV